MASNFHSTNKSQGSMSGTPSGPKDGVSEASKFRADQEGPSMGKTTQRQAADKPMKAGGDNC